MQRLPGTAYERDLPADISGDPGRVRRMVEALIDQIAEMHTVDLAATGLDQLEDGHDHLTRELDRWEGEVRRVRRGPVPALERLIAELRASQPAQTPTITLVHGDCK